MSLVIDQLTKLNTRVAQLLAGVQISKKLLDSVATNAVQVAQDAAQVAEDRQRSHEDRLVVELAEEVVVASTAVATEYGKLAIAAAEASGPVKIYDTFEAASAVLPSLPENQVVRILVDGNYGNRQSFYRKEQGVLVFKSLEMMDGSARFSQEWANNPENKPVSKAAGGDGSTKFSALHYAAKASKLLADGGPLPIIAAGSTTARSLASRFGETANVKDFGAMGNGGPGAVYFRFYGAA